jgi:hypothetical protein
MKNLMKFPAFVLLAFLSLAVVSCESDDDNAPALTNANLAGTYDITAFSGMASETDSSGGVTDISTTTFSSSNFNNATITFTEDGTISSTGSFTFTAVITEDGRTETEVEITDVDINGTYTINANSLIVSDLDDASATVRNFSSNGLQLFLQETETETDYTFEAESTYTLVRQ